VSKRTGGATYWLAGLRVASELPLSPLVPWSDEFPAGDEVLITRSSLPAVPLRTPHGHYDESGYVLAVPGIARFLIRQGKEILVDPAADSEREDVVTFLLGSAFGILCHQRGIIPLHAAAIDFEDGCVAFAGDSGAGRSTLAAALAARGHNVISDDVCFLEQRNDGVVRAWPGVGRVRLSEATIAALDIGRAGLIRETRGNNKFLVPMRSPIKPGEPRLLKRIYQLRGTTEDARPSVTRVRGATTIDVLMSNVYRLECAEEMGLKPAIFARCVALAQNVSVFEFTRAMGFDALQAGIDMLLDQLRQSSPT